MVAHHPEEAGKNAEFIIFNRFDKPFYSLSPRQTKAVAIAKFR